MAISWFIVPYKRRVGAYPPTRYCEMDDHTGTILADDGRWAEAEVLGNRAVVKVRASVTTLQNIILKEMLIALNARRG